MSLDIQVILYPNQIFYFHKCARLSLPKTDTTTYSIPHVFVFFCCFYHVTLTFLPLGGGVYVFSLWAWKELVSPSTNRVQWKWFYVPLRQTWHFCLAVLGQLFSESSHWTMRKSRSYTDVSCVGVPQTSPTEAPTSTSSIGHQMWEIEPPADSGPNPRNPCQL